jgi:hypothetical protein
VLLEFRVSNFRSIWQEVTLSAVAVSRTARPRVHRDFRRYRTDAEIGAPILLPERGIPVVPVLGVFGANESGKTNLMLALRNVQQFLGDSRRDGSHVQPFLLHPTAASEPTRFRIVAACGGCVWDYTFWVDRSRVVLEELGVRLAPPARRRLVLRREWRPASRTYACTGPALHQEGSSDIRRGVTAFVCRKKYPAAGSFLDWVSGIEFVDPGAIRDQAQLWGDVLYDADKLRSVGPVLSGLGSRIRELGRAGNALVAMHEGDGGALVAVPFTEESLGNQRLLALLPQVIQRLQHGGLLLVDELDASLHPHVVRRLIELFQNSATNPGRGQLIFTSHDATLFGGDVLRRDQTWFTQRRPNGSTELYCLSDFRIRHDLARERAYLDGRFGGVPALADESELAELVGAGR